MSRPQRNTTSGATDLDLQNRARRENKPTDELLTIYVLERFLYRLSISDYRSRFVLKGGMLLAVFDGRRATRDVDLLGLTLSNDIEEVSRTIRTILEIPVDDGVQYDVSAMTSGIIREDDLYTGARIVIPAFIDRAKVALRVDVNVGDPVTPAPKTIDYPTLFGDTTFRLLGYPITNVLAEKIVTMLDRGDINTRERDFIDVYLLIRRHEIRADELRAALLATAQHRSSQLQPIADTVQDLPLARQKDWTRIVAKYGVGNSVPEEFAAVVNEIARFADPILTTAVHDATWDPAERRWHSGTEA